MRYFGSKTSTVDSVFELVTESIPRGTLCDPFGGIGVVGSYFKARGFRVVSGDILKAAHSFQVARIQLNRRPQFKSLRAALRLRSSQSIAEYLMAIPKAEGWLVEQYARRRQFFTVDNARRINACWLEISHWKRDGLVSSQEAQHLAASLIASADRVANTAGTYYAFLKAFDRKALKPFLFSSIEPAQGRQDCKALFQPASEVVSQNRCDVLYLDPPYNERSYGSYYHLPETLAGTSYQKVVGVCGMPVNHASRSEFNSPSNAEGALIELLLSARARMVILHYADDGIIPRKTLRALLPHFGRVTEHVLTGLGYTSVRKKRTVSNRLYMLRSA